MVGLARKSYKDLGSKLRPPLINQYIKICQEDVMEFEDRAKVVTLAMTWLDKAQEEGENQAQRKAQFCQE